MRNLARWSEGQEQERASSGDHAARGVRVPDTEDVVET